MKKNAFFALLINLLLLAPIMAQVTCPTDVTIDGTTYPVVRIGSQCWTAQNMRHSHYADGVAIDPAGMTYDARGTITLDPNTYGKLYTGNAAMRNHQVSANGELQGICPNGWHIPTTAEVDAMMSLYTPKQVMSTQGWIPAEGTNESGFDMLPAGFYNASMNNFERAYVTGIFWTTTPGTTVYHKCQFGSACSSWEIVPGDTVYAYSVRCIRDTTDTITFVANGGAESMVQQLVTRNIPTALNTNAFAHDGNWEFIGWNDACDGNGTTYADGANITTNGNVTLYAQWHTWCTGTPLNNELGTARIDSVKDHQNNWYKVVEIGTGANKQCWLKENMRATTEPTAPGTSILKDKAAGISYTERRAYYYDDLLANGEKYGCLYNFLAAMDIPNLSTSFTQPHQGICPEGWHIPSDVEWMNMEKMVAPTATDINTTTTTWQGTYTNLAVSLSGGCDWEGDDGTGRTPRSYSNAKRDSSGFSVLPTGYFSGNVYYRINQWTYFWTATLDSDNTNRTFRRALYYDRKGMLRNSNTIDNGFSVRCVRDERIAITDTITFVPNGGANTMPKQVVTRGTATALNTNAFTHGGNWEFIGWSTNGTDSVAYTNQANITTNGNDTLYAVWHTWCTGTANSNELGTARIDSVKDHQDNWYKVVEIGTGANKQCWLKENMRATTEPTAPGTSILKTSEYSASAPMAYRYDNSTTYSDIYGLLYNFPAAMNINDQSTSFTYPHQGICPQGWHVPTDGEWQAMEVTVGIGDAATMATSGWLGDNASRIKSGNDWNNSNISETYLNPERNIYGLSVTPGGYKDPYAGSRLLGENGFFWTSTPNSTDKTWCHELHYISEKRNHSAYNRFYGFSVRCVRDVVVKDTITFIPNGATGGTMAKQVVTRGTATVLNTNAFTHDGNWEFRGWNDACDGNGTTYADGANITTNGNVTLYAQWHTWCTGTAKSNELGTSRIDSVKDHQDNWYKVVEIGTGANKQCWLKENMRATTSPKGNLTAGGSITSYFKAYYYDYTSATQFSLRERGYLYNWAGAIDTNGTGNISASFTGRRGICPEGWYIPTDEEWMNMEKAVAPTATDINTSAYAYQGASTDLAASLSGGCDWSGDGGTGKTPNSYSNPNRNSSGFSALPAGYCNGSSFYGAGNYAHFWSATSSGGDYAYYRYLDYSNAGVRRNRYYKNYGFSVRCVRDVVPLVPKLGLCETCSEGTITVKVSENVASIVWRNSDNDSVSNSLTGLTQSTSIPAGVYTATATSSDGHTVTRTATLGKATARPCTVASLNAGTSLAGGKYANKEFGSGTRLDSVSDHQGNVYRVAQIGEGANAQCWLAENMRCTTSPSTSSTIVLGNFSSFISSHHSKCAINHDSTRYGVLYNWCAAVDTFDADGGKPEVANETDFSGWNFALPAGNRRGICPEGWHIPTNDEWTSMASLAGVGQGSDTGVSKLSGGCDWPIKDDGTYPGSYADSERNSTGFSALPAGNIGGMRTYVGIMAFFWSATSNGQQAYARIINKDNQYLESQAGTNRYSALSVRCVRDVTGLTLGAITKTDSTANTLSISAAYTATQTVTGATICAYTDAECTYPAGTCATVVDYASSPITGTVTDLTGGTQYYVKVTATTAGGSESAVAGPFGTAPTMSITSNPTSAKVCSGDSVQITFTATLNGATASSYSWSVSDGTGSSTTDTITVTATAAGTVNVTCTAAGVSATKSTTVTAGTVPTLGLCEECFNDSIQVKVKTNVASIVWRNSLNDSISNSLTGLKKSATIPAGVYTAIAKSSDGCSVSRSAVLGNYVPHPCTVTAKRDNEAGTATSIDSVKDHQNNWYKVVQIGEGADAQCWLAENMRATTSPSTHSTIVFGGASDYVSSYSSKCAINHNDSKYGVLYNWCAAVDTFDANGGRPELANAPGHSSSTWSVTMPAGNRRGICPEGWHIPTDDEWTSMASLAGVGQDSGTGVSKLSDGCDWQLQSSGTYPGSYSVADRNSTGFSALPAGYCNSSSIGDIGTCAYFWSVTPNTSAEAYNRYLYKERQFVYRYCYYRNYAFSVRCVRDRVLRVITAAVTNITTSGATCGGNVVDDGGKAVTARGVCWSKSAYPTINDSHTSDGTGTGNFSSTISVLDSAASYYVRAYATNSDDTVYGDQKFFTTLGCLAAGTRITMADGSYKNVENIVVGDLVRTFNHETGEISSAEICMAWKSENTKRALNLTFASGKSVGIVGTHDFLFENTRKYVRINQDNVAEYVGKRFYNAESGFWDALVSYEMGAAVNYYCPYTAKHLNCLAEGMLTCPDDVDYILNIYELDANLQADSAQLAADIAQYGLCNVANDFPEFVQYKEQMDNLGAPYLYIAIGKGLVPRSIIDDIKNYWTEQ